jgi:Cof subfamily protein (haloacid dehalogenase superfamily)
MKTLYVTDLDGTLLNSNTELSAYTIKTINKLVDEGMCFSYATARSLSSASVVTKGLAADIPVIIYNGAFIVHADTGEKVYSLYFNEHEKERVAGILNELAIYPLVYGYINGNEHVSWLRDKENDGIANYVRSRKGDKRLRPVDNTEQLYAGELFYFTCIGKRDRLKKLDDCFRDSGEFVCTFQQELYREEYWFEIMPGRATKGNAIVTLKNILNCDKIVSFGDRLNDIPMFLISDQCYAVENAMSELKTHATAIIPSNNDDGVARWLKDNYKK